MLLQHNKETLEQINEYLDDRKDCCVVNPCGSGKTMLMIALIKNHPNDTFTVVTKQKNAAKYYRSKDEVFSQDNVRIITYSKMLLDTKNDDTKEYETDYYLLDEAQYLGAPNWKEAFIKLRKEYKPICIGFTATPQRFEQQGSTETIVEDFFDGNSAGNFTQQDLEAQGVFIRPEYVLSLYGFDEIVKEKTEEILTADIDEAQKKRLCKKLTAVKKTWETQDCPEVVLKQTLPEFMYKQQSNRILVYVANMSELRVKATYITKLIRKAFPEKKIKTYRYTCHDSEHELADFLKEENDIYIKILFGIDKITETVHIDDLSTIIMLRPSISNRIITQQFGRINGINQMHKSLIIDMVNNLSSLDSMRMYRVGQAQHTASSGQKRVNLNLHYIQKYSNIFKAFDKALMKPVYRYKGFYGTFDQVCKVAGRRPSEVKSVMDETGCNIRDAIAATAFAKSTWTDVENETYEFTLSDEQRNLATNNIAMLDSFFVKYNVKDEDIKSQLSYYYLYLVSQYATGTYQISFSVFISGRLFRKYLQILKDNNVKDRFYEVVDPDVVAETWDYSPILEAALIQAEDDQFFDTLFSRVTEREAQVIKMRFGFDSECKTLAQCGEVLGIQGERVRQIENKAFRTFRRFIYHHGDELCIESKRHYYEVCLTDHVVEEAHQFKYGDKIVQLPLIRLMKVTDYYCLTEEELMNIGLWPIRFISEMYRNKYEAIEQDLLKKYRANGKVLLLHPPEVTVREITEDVLQGSAKARSLGSLRDQIDMFLLKNILSVPNPAKLRYFVAAYHPSKEQHITIPVMAYDKYNAELTLKKQCAQNKYSLEKFTLFEISQSKFKSIVSCEEDCDLDNNIIM